MNLRQEVLNNPDVYPNLFTIETKKNKLHFADFDKQQANNDN